MINIRKFLRKIRKHPTTRYGLTTVISLLIGFSYGKYIGQKNPFENHKNYFGIESELTSSGKNLYLNLKNYSLSLDLSDSSINYSLAIQELMKETPNIDLVNHYFNKMDKLLHIQQMNVYYYFAKTFVKLPKSDKDLYRKLYFQNKELLKYQMLNLPYLIGVDFSDKKALKNNRFRKIPDILH